MQTLYAKVVRHNEKYRRLLGSGKLLFASSLKIEETPEGWFLIGLDADGRENSDSWHETLEDAKEQARVEFGTPLTEWLST